MRKSLVSIAAIAVLLLATYSTQLLQSSPLSQRSGDVYVFNLESVAVSGGPGSVRTITLSLSYYGRYTLLGSAVSLQPQCNATVLSDQPVQLGSWRPGTVKVASFTVDTSKATVRCPVELVVSWSDSWDDAYGMNTQLSGSSTLKATVTACWFEDLRVGVVPQIVYVDSVNSVLLDVLNSGSSSMREVTIIVSGQGATLINASLPLSYQLREIPPGKRFTAALQLVPQSSFPSLAVTVSYVDCAGNFKTVSYNVPMYASPGQSIVVVPDPATVVAGTRSEVALKVVNVGSVEAKNLRVVLNLQASPLAINPAVIDSGDLKPGDVKTFTVHVDVPSTASASTLVSYQTIYYIPGSGPTFTQGSFTLFILQRSSLSITSIEVVPSRATVDSNVVFAVNLINDGTYPVYAVNVTAYPPEGLTPARSPSTFLGQLNPQVLTSIPFTFKAAREGSYEVKFRATYRDAYGNTAYVERTAVVEVIPASPETLKSRSYIPGGVFLWVAVLALLAAGGYYFYRKTRSRGAGG
ncbi:hypothetical protein IG193_08355 [Infirmifilum lucidum]|uniref:CARDB domain-containing protein n=1 Tax=Infirmifilum lucidum TaxID=2776706 RepID=A0A7L9FIK5_9CREN|nr:hypothetical protein [Infirmifilum lucidum]QOJ78746.1 hypothetical protein IG193_08355 [Infirmifilum lucidum]